MSWLSSAVSGGGIGKLLGIAAPFAKSSWLGAGLGLAGSLLGGGGNAQGQAQDAAGGQNDIAKQQAAIFQQYAPNAAAGIAGYTDPNNNPYSKFAGTNFSPTSIGTRTADIYSPQEGTIGDTYGQDAINKRAGQLFDPSQLTGDMVRYQEAGDPAYDSAVEAANADIAGRGFFSPNTLTSSAIGNIRQAQAQDNAGARRDLVGNLLKSKLGYIAGQEDTGNQLQNNLASNMSNYRMGQFNQGLGLQGQGIDTALNADRDLSGIASNSAQGAQGTFGGLRGFYADAANQQNTSLNNAIGSLTQAGLKLPSLSGIFGNIFGQRKQSTSLGTTNAQAPTPTQGPDNPWWNSTGGL